MVELSPAQREELERLMRTPSAPNQLAQRARIVLRAAEGATNRQIAAELGVSLPTVGLWRTAFVRAGAAGLADAPRWGRPRTLDEATAKLIVAKTLEPPPAGTTHWSVRGLARHRALPPTTVHRIWREPPQAPSGALVQVLQRPAARREGHRRRRPLPRPARRRARALRR